MSVNMKSSGGESPDIRRRATPEVNVKQMERILSAALGGALLARGFSHGSLRSVLFRLGTAAALLYRGISGHSRLYEALDGDTTQSSSLRPGIGGLAGAMEVERAIIIEKSADELYQVWCKPETLTRIMNHFAEVSVRGENGTHWQVLAPGARRIEWDARVVEERAGELLRWCSIPGSELPNEGRVRFRPAPGGRGTEVALRIRFEPPRGSLGDTTVKQLGIAPRTIALETLSRFKALVETGKPADLEPNPSAGKGASTN